MGHVSKYLVLLLILVQFAFTAMINMSLAEENVSTLGEHEQNYSNLVPIDTPNLVNPQQKQDNSVSWNNRAVPMMSRLFVWSGFIISIGLVAKILTTFNEQKVGLLTVIFVGSVGALVSMILLPCLWRDGSFQPISPIGFIVAVIVAFLILSFYSKFLRLFGKENV